MSLNEAVAYTLPTHPAPDVAAEPVGTPVAGASNLLDPGFHLTLRPMRYPQFYDMYTTPSATPGRWRRSTSPTTSSTCSASCCPPNGT